MSPPEISGVETDNTILKTDGAARYEISSEITILSLELALI